FFDDNEDHSVQYKEYLENSSKEITGLNSNQEKEKPQQDSNIHQFVREKCGINIFEKQKKIMEDTMLELIEVCRRKEFYCMHDNVDDLIESALNSKILSINLNSQRLNKEKQEVKNVVEQPAEHGTRIVKSFQNFRVIHKNSTSLKNTSQVSPVHAITPVLPNEEPEYSLSMGYEHLNTTPETESNEIIKYGVKKLLPIPSEYEVTSNDESECEVPIKDDSSPTFTNFSNPLFDNNDFTSNDDELLPDEDVPIEEFKVYSNPLFDMKKSINFLKEFSGALMPIRIANEERITREHAEYISLMERLITINPCPMEISNMIVESLSSSLIPVQDNDSQREEIDIVTNTDELLPPGFDDDDSKGEIDVLEELRVDNSIPNSENEFSDNEASDFDDPSFPRPPPEPPDAEFDFEPNSGEEISAVMNNIEKLIDDECFDPGGEIDVFCK
nr:hypothetical protein [Tanacetum cinerariifolium]